MTRTSIVKWIGPFILVGLVVGCASKKPASEPAVTTAPAQAEAEKSKGTARQDAQTLSREGPLTNPDVVKLTKLGLGDQVVIAKINQAKAVNFDLGTDALVKLKSDGVSDGVISVMLQRTTPQNQGSSGAASSGASIDSSVPASVWMRSKAGDVELIGRRGETRLVNVFFTALRMTDYPGIGAKVRVHDLRPAILAPLKEDPKSSQAFLVKLEPDRKNDKRSLKIGQGYLGAFAGIVGGGQGGIPDSDWTIAYNASEERPGIWSVAPKTNLVPGEYGYYFRGVLYDFAVDE